MKKTICELFAGVGGFRLGFDRLNSGWETVWFSQWEPAHKKQAAHDCYVRHFGVCADLNGEYHTNEDITTVGKNAIPDHTLLVGGFPCQDYSVASPLSAAPGITGAKGMLWWQVRDILAAKQPAFCLLENVDRLLQSPKGQRGRDFGLILGTFAEYGYQVECAWSTRHSMELPSAGDGPLFSPTGRTRCTQPRCKLLLLKMLSSQTVSWLRLSRLLTWEI